MYLEFFGFERAPFNLTPDPRFLYLGERHREALASLEYGITSRKGFTVLTGDIGAGKTTLCRSLLRRLPAQTKAALIVNSYLTDLEILQVINDEFGVPCDRPESKKALVDALNQFLIAECAAGNDALVVIDEAQNLSPVALEQVRMLSNLETESDKLLQILLMGQPELRDVLRLPELEQLNQRVTVRYHLGPLTEAEVREYIEHRMSVAGENHHAAFASKAYRRIYDFSRGIPRKINLVADRALLAAYGAESHDIYADMVDSAIEEVAGEELEEVEQEQRREAAREPAGNEPVQTAPQPTQPQQTAPPPFPWGPYPGPYPYVSYGPATATMAPPQMQQFQAPAAPAYLQQNAPQASPTSADAQASEAPRPATLTASAGRGTARGLLVALLIFMILLSAGAMAFAVLAFVDPVALREFTGLRKTPPGSPASGALRMPERPATAAADAPPAAAPSKATPAPTPAPTPTPTPTPLPAVLAQEFPDPWTVDDKGMVRIESAAHARLAAELSLLRKQFGIDINTRRIASLSDEVLERLSILDLPELKERGLRSVKIEDSLAAVAELAEPAILQVSPRSEMSVSPALLFLGHEARPGTVRIGDPKYGLGTLPMQSLERIFVDATVFYFDEKGLSDLKPGAEGAKVRLLEDYLTSLDFWPEDGIGPNGRYDLQVREAVQRFQGAHDLRRTGEVDPTTVFHLLRAIGRQELEVPASDEEFELPEGADLP